MLAKLSMAAAAGTLQATARVGRGHGSSSSAGECLGVPGMDKTLFPCCAPALTPVPGASYFHNCAPLLSGPVHPAPALGIMCASSPPTGFAPGTNLVCYITSQYIFQTWMNSSLVSLGRMKVFLSTQEGKTEACKRSNLPEFIQVCKSQRDL